MRKVLQLILTPIHPSRCFYAMIFGLIGGIVTSNIFTFVWLKNWIIVLILAVFAIPMILYARVIFMVIIFFVGLVLGNARFLPELSNQELWQNLINNEIVITGKIAEDPNETQGAYKLKLKNLQIQIPPGDTSEDLGGTVYVQIVSKDTKLERSDQITIRGKAREGFGIYAASFYRPSLEQVRRAESGDVFARIKNWFATIIRKFIPAPEAELGLGYLMGMKDMPEDLSETLRMVGMTHVVVASGTHLGILVGVAKKFFGKISKFAGLLFAILFIMAFVMVVGFTPSMTRAALVASLSMLVGYFGRRFSPLRLLGLVAALTLMVEPTNFINLGWQLSFASFFGILILAPRIQKLLYGGKNPPWLAGMLITSFATTVICLPVLVYSFGTISLLSFVANLIILPTLPYAMLLVFLTGAFGFMPWLAIILAQVTKMLLDLHINLVNFLSQQKSFIFELPSGDVRIFLVYLPILALILWIFRLTKVHAKQELRLDTG